MKAILTYTFLVILVLAVPGLADVSHDAWMAPSDRSVLPESDTTGRRPHGLDVSPFCENPVEAVCNQAMRLRLDFPAGIRKNTVEALLDGSRALPENLLDSTHKDWATHYKSYLEGLKETAQMPMQRIEGEFAKVREQIVAAVADQGFERRQEFMKKLDAVKVDSYINYTLENWSEDNLLLFLSTCGADGLSQNASYSRDKGLILICPIYQTYEIPDEQRRRVLGHEIGHAIDAHEFSEAYAELMRCYTENVTGYDPAFKNEVISDHWTVEAFALRHANATPEELLDAAAKGFFHYCFSRENSPLKTPERVAKYNQKRTSGIRVHPQDEFRLGSILGRNPKVRKIMGCVSSAVTAPACGITGRVR